MDPAIISEVAAGVAGVVTSWARIAQRRRDHRDKARKDLAQGLPAGSRIIDLGSRGVVIEVGNRSTPPD